MMLGRLMSLIWFALFLGGCHSKKLEYLDEVQFSKIIQYMEKDSLLIIYGSDYEKEKLDKLTFKTFAIEAPVPNYAISTFGTDRTGLSDTLLPYFDIDTIQHKDWRNMLFKKIDFEIDKQTGRAKDATKHPEWKQLSVVDSPHYFLLFKRITNKLIYAYLIPAKLGKFFDDDDPTDCFDCRHTDLYFGFDNKNNIARVWQ